MRSFHWLVSLSFGAIILLTAGAAVLRALPYDVPAGTDLVEGGLTRGFESHYDKQFPAKTFGTNLWGAIQYLLFGEGRSGVVVGRDGWLYTQEEFRDYPDSEQQIEARLRLIQRAQEELQQRGTELVVALLPAKVRVYPEHLGQQAPAAVHRELYGRTHRELTRRGIVAPDLLLALQGCKENAAMFLRTDTHWTPEGADCSAAAIAAVLAPLGEAQQFDTQTQSAQTHAGDLMQFLPLAPYFAALLPAPDLLLPRTTSTEGGDLFGDAPTPQIVLVGTSYSADARWNFDGALREALAADVLNLAESGRGPFEPMLDFLALPVAEASPKRVIWEIPERYLPAGEPLKDQGRVHVAQAHP